MQYQRCPRNGKQAKPLHKATVLQAWEGVGEGRIPLASPDTGLDRRGNPSPPLSLKGRGEKSTAFSERARWAHSDGNPNPMKHLSLAAVCGSAAIVTFISPSVWAEDVTSLDEIVVTADRKARTVDATLAPVSIITRQDIEQYQASSVPEVLRRLPGISLSNSGGVGKASSVFIRGANSSHVLVLVDGIKVGSATTGSVAFEDLPLEQVERIEVVRGPRSSLYGSEAIGGVIQIFTRKGGNGFQPEISLGLGSHNTQQASVNLAGGDGTGWYNLNAGRDKTDGINVTSDAGEPDKDGYARDSISLRAGRRFAQGTEAEMTVLRAAGENHFDSSFNNETRFTQQVVGGKLKHAVGDKLLLTAQLGQALDEADNYLNGTPLVAYRTYDTRRDTASLQADVGVGDNASFSVGLDQQQDTVHSDSAYAHTSRDNTGAFASVQAENGANRLDVSVRHDDNGQFGKHNTGGLAVGRDLANGMRVTAAYATAFKAPTFNDLYYPFSGNPALRPESSRHLEVGFQGEQAGVQWQANVFHNQVDDLIAWAPDAEGNWTPANVNQARIRGLEASASTRLAGWDVSANLTLQQPQNRKGLYAGNTLIYRPQQLANVDIGRTFGRLRAGVGLQAEGKRYTDEANTASETLPGYATLDVRADYQPVRDWTIGAKIGNVLDKDYQTNKGYNQDGIHGLVTVKYAPK